MSLAELCTLVSVAKSARFSNHATILSQYMAYSAQAWHVFFTCAFQRVKLKEATNHRIIQSHSSFEVWG